jgi:hypothetical protein
VGTARATVWRPSRTAEDDEEAFKSDAKKPSDKLMAMVNEIRRRVPTLTIEQAYELASIPKPEWASAATRKTKSDTEPEPTDPEAAYEKLMEMAEEKAERENITVEKAFAKLYEKNTPLAKLASKHGWPMEEDGQRSGSGRDLTPPPTGRDPDWHSTRSMA